MADSRLPPWPYEVPLEESPRQLTGAMPWLTALSNWMGMALPGRGGVGDPTDPLKKLVLALMNQERPVGKQRIPGDLSWVAREAPPGGRPGLTLKLVNDSPQSLTELSRYPEITGGILLNTLDPNKLEVMKRMLSSGVDRDVTKKILLESLKKPWMGWRQNHEGRFKF